MYNCNLDDVVKNVKAIVENSRCVLCDQLNVRIVRYPCGHSSCSDCVETAEDCLLCLTPTDAPAHFIDEPSSQRVRNASELLKTFQELFQIDVYRRQRVSDKLKLEKQLFPECIQASTKYCNKRKSLNTTGKENKRLSSLPGEKIVLNKLTRMENTVNYVEKWLNKNESIQMAAHKKLPRKPFTDLNVNQTSNKDANNLGFQTSNKKSRDRKRTHLKIIKDTSYVPKVSSKRAKKETNIKEYELKNKNKCENNESGIFIDDETIDIDDSQCEVIDKDRLAWLEVCRAHENDHSDDDDENRIKITTNIDEPNKSGEEVKTYRVPFFKKSALFCNTKTDTNDTQSKNITVTIDSDSFVTTIKVSKLDENAACSSKSTAAQTDTDATLPDKIELNNVTHIDTVVDVKSACSSKYTAAQTDTDAALPDKIELNNVTHKDIVDVKSACSRKSTAAQTDTDTALPDKIELNNVTHKDIVDVKSNKVEPNFSVGRKRKCLIIEESDSDSDVDGNVNLEVTADVHRSDAYVSTGVLCELEQNDYEHRTKHAVRELTPHSSDSSDKENYDPNRIKRRRTDKKNCNKK